MKHCKNCTFCRIDVLAQYVNGYDLHKCDMTDEVVLDPFWEGRDCAYYEKSKFGFGGFSKWFTDCLKIH